MIRFSMSSDLEQIIGLWSSIFGDTYDEIRFFCQYKYKPDNTIVYEIDGKIVSSLFLLEGKISINGEDYPAYYLYAACTSKECRGRGIMSQMISFSKETAKARGFDFICLKPASDSLFEYYRRNGYKTVFYSRKTVLEKKDLTDITFTDFDYNCEAEDCFYLRDKALEGNSYFKWDKESVEFAFLFNKIYGGLSTVNCNGYSLYSIENDILTVKETTFTAKYLLSFSKYCFEKLNISKIEFNTPVWYNLEGASSEIIPSGMIISVSDDDSSVNEINNGYLGLTLD